MAYRDFHEGPGLTRFLAQRALGLCPGCSTHVTWFGVPLFPGMGADLGRMKRCPYIEEHSEMQKRWRSL